MSITWAMMKDFLDSRGVSPQFVEFADMYMIAAIDGPFQVTCVVYKDGGAEVTEFEADYKVLGNTSQKNEVVTQFEKNDKTLRTFWVSNTTDASGLVRFAIQIPANGRFIAYGDAEFEEREFLDSISKIEVSDLDRLIAWEAALAVNPSATEPVSDAAMQASGDPRFTNYPVLDHYDERSLASGSSSVGSQHGGLAMSFQYGITEAQPVGGYAQVPGSMYLVIECQKETAVAGKRCKISIDWAEPHD
jgi:hypothetical protein